MPFIKIDNLSTGEISRVKNANFDKNSVFRGHYLAKPELGDQVKYEKIILQWGTINFKSNFHGIFPHFVGIRPQKFNFVKKIRYFLYFLAFFAGHPEPSKSYSNQYLSNFGLFAWRTSRNVKIQDFLLLQLSCEDP